MPVPVVMRVLVAVLPFTFRGARGGGRTAATGAVTGTCTGRADSAATCWTSCWRRMSITDNAWLLVGAGLGASIRLWKLCHSIVI